MKSFKNYLEYKDLKSSSEELKKIILSGVENKKNVFNALHNILNSIDYAFVVSKNTPGGDYSMLSNMFGLAVQKEIAAAQEENWSEEDFQLFVDKLHVLKDYLSKEE